jgi:hypothetical protein
MASLFLLATQNGHCYFSPHSPPLINRRVSKFRRESPLQVYLCVYPDQTYITEVTLIGTTMVKTIETKTSAKS